MIVKANVINLECNLISTAIIEPFDHRNEGLVIAKSINSVSTEMPVMLQMFNFANEAIEIKQGTPLALAHEIDDNTIESFDHIDEDIIESRLKTLSINPSMTKEQRQQLLEVIRANKNAFS